MTTKALPAQYEAVRRLSQDAVGDEWWALDKHLDPDSATYEGLEAIRDALHRVLEEGKGLSRQGKKGMLESIMAGRWRPAAPDPPVEELIPEPDLTALRKALDEQPVVGTATKTLEGLGYEPYQPKKSDASPVKQGDIDGGIPTPNVTELTSGSSMTESMNQSVIEPEANAQPEEETLPRTRKPIVHGDRKGYQAHRRRGEEPCEDCKVGNRRDQAKYRKLSTRKKPDLKATTSPKPRATSARSRASKPAKKPNGAWVQTDEGRAIARVETAHLNGANPIGRYLNLLLTLAESQDVPDPALLDKIDKLIGIAL